MPMLRPLKLALWLIISLAFLLLIAVTVILNIDLGRFSATAEQQLSALLEREVAFDGELSVRIGSRIEIALSQARVGGGNADLPDLLKIGKADVALATLPLLKGRVEVLNATLDDIAIALVEQTDGSNNFTFPGSDDSAVDGDSAGPTIRLANIAMRSLSLRYQTPDRTAPLDLELSQAAITQKQDDTDISLRGQVQGVALKLDTDIIAGRLDDGTPDFTITLAGQLGEIEAQGVANLDDLLAPRRPRGKFRLTGPDARYLTDLLKINPFTEGPLDLNIELQEQDQRLKGDVEGRFGEFTLHSKALLDLPISMANAELSLDASGPELARLATLTGLPESFDGPFTVKGQVSPATDALDVRAEISTTTLSANVQGSLPSGADLSKITARISLAGDSLAATGDKLGAANLPAQNYQVDTHLKLEENRFRFEDLDVKLGAHEVSGGLTFVMDDKHYQIEDLVLALDTVHQLKGQFAIAHDLSGGDFDLNASSPDLFKLAERPQQLPDNIPGQLALDVQGGWQDEHWQLQQLDAQFANSQLSSAGRFDRPPYFQQTDLSIEMSIGSLAAYSQLAGRDLPDLPAQLAFKLQGNPASVQAKALTGQLGKETFSGSAAWVDGPLPQVTVALTADRLDLSPFLPPPTEATRETEAPAVSEAEMANARIIPDLPLSLEELQQQDLKFSLNVGELSLAPRLVSDLTLQVMVKDGALTVPEFSLKAKAGSFRGELSLLPDPAGVKLLADLSGEGITLGLPATTPEDVAALPQFQMSSILIGQGATTRELAASLDGYLALSSGEGRIRAEASRYFAGDFVTSMVSTLNPFRKVEESTEIRCSALAITARSGLLEGEPMLILLTNRFSAELQGKIDLNNEGLDINIRTIAEKGLGVGLTDLINPFTRVGGTLARPRVELDPDRAVREGSFYIATLGLSLAAKRYRDRKLAGQDRCELMLAKANTEFEKFARQYQQASQAPR